MGAMGKGLLYQTTITPDIECIAIADKDLQRCIDCAKWLKLPYRIVDSQQQMLTAILNKELAICTDGMLVATCPYVELFIESTSAIYRAAEFSEAALKNHKHLVLMNAEIDLIFGPYLMRLAHDKGVTYTSCDGDQHGVIKRLIDDIQLWGFKLVMAGNIKGFLDRYSNPTKIIPEADKRNLDYKMATAYTDGTKLCREMALVANAIGMRPTGDTMKGPPAKTLNEVFELFDLRVDRVEHIRHDSHGCVKQPVVDYIVGAEPGGGVFVVGESDNEYQMDMMKYYKMGDGPYYIFYRPYHLCHVEAMQCCFDAVQGKSLLEPTCGFQTNVYAVAKKDMSVGDKLDGVGGYTCYGELRTHDSARLPICLCEDLLLIKSVQKDRPLFLDDVSGWECKGLNTYRPDFRMYFEGCK